MITHTSTLATCVYDMFTYYRFCTNNISRRGGFNFHAIRMAADSITCRLISIHCIDRLRVEPCMFIMVTSRSNVVLMLGQRHIQRFNIQPTERQVNVLTRGPLNVFPFDKQISVYLKAQKLSGDFSFFKF